MTQPNLFDDAEPQTMPDAQLIRSKPRARKTDPETSHAAARQVEASGTAKRHGEMIVTALRANDGLTSEELASRAGLDRVAAARRMKELETDGRIRRGPPRKSAITGRPGVTWWLVK